MVPGPSPARAQGPATSEQGVDQVCLLINRLFGAVRTVYGEVDQRLAPRSQFEFLFNSPLESTRGRPRYCIIKDQLQQLRATGMPWCSIAAYLCISEWTLFRRRQQYGMTGENYGNISNSELDNIIREILRETPNAGGNYVQGTLIQITSLFHGDLCTMDALMVTVE
ncbi:hypothetical protein AOXY_G15860 [Acipenser oxyrinchus oxyrinchus]|uniref:Uncharacterized protein n=1 Tax=Acipenser oxyrinchus oxyrinchus TaxID=40147 RepID=A0AAD8D666_ACIOX|nr:hypothetical protein AOXY_G15860 [Acipenser oxyrinchus oxyrinchus]